MNQSDRNEENQAVASNITSAFDEVFANILSLTENTVIGKFLKELGNKNAITILNLMSQLDEYKKQAKLDEVIICKLNKQLEVKEEQLKKCEDYQKQMEDEIRSLKQELEKRDTETWSLKRRSDKQKSICELPLGEEADPILRTDPKLETQMNRIDTTEAKLLKAEREMTSALESWSSKIENMVKNYLIGPLEKKKHLENLNDEELSLYTIRIEPNEQNSVILDLMSQIRNLRFEKDQMEAEKNRVESEKAQIEAEKKQIEEENLLLKKEIDNDKEILCEKEKEWQKKFDEMSQRLVSAANEYQKLAKNKLIQQQLSENKSQDINQKNELIQWKSATNGEVGPDAVAGGIEGEITTFVGRVLINGQPVPGKIVREHKCCYVAYQGKEFRFTEYEYLDKPSFGWLTWKPASNGRVPTGAVVGGVTIDGIPMFVARANIEHHLLVGKMQSNRFVCKVAWGGKVINADHYEVLCLTYDQ